MGRRLSALPIAGLAVPGVVAGHALTYLVTIRSAAHRSEILAGTGHSYWSTATAVAVVAGLLAAAAAAVRALRRPTDDEAGWSLGRVTAKLWVLQSGAYLAIEALERLFAGASPADALHHGILPTGIPIQLAVAACGALLLRMLARTVELISRAERSPAPPRTNAASWVPRPAPALRSRAFRGAWGPRGPPPRPVFAAGR